MNDGHGIDQLNETIDRVKDLRANLEDLMIQAGYGDTVRKANENIRATKKQWDLEDELEQEAIDNENANPTPILDISETNYCDNS